MKKYNILHLEDIATDAELAANELRNYNINFEQLVIDSKEEYLRALDDFMPDIILCDHSLPAFNSVEALKLLKAKKLQIPFIIITATMSEQVANEVVTQGADDYILKDRLKRLPIAVLNALDRNNFEKEKRELLSLVQQKEQTNKKQLQDLSNSLRLATEIAGIGVWKYYIERDEVVWDEQMYAMFGIKKSRFKGDYQSFNTYVHPDDRAGFLKQMKEAIKAGGSFNTEFRIIWPSDGSVHYIKSKSFIFADEAGKSSWMLGTIKDVTARILSEKKLSDSYRLIEAAYQQQATILDSLRAHIAFLDSKGNIISVNQAWKNFADENALVHHNYGINDNYFNICNAATGDAKPVAKAVVKAIKQVLSGSISEYSTEYSCNSPQKDKWFRITITPLYNNYLNGAVVAHSNITHRKLNEQQLERQNEALKKANSELDRFVYSASHELRSPLTSVLGLAQIGKAEQTTGQVKELFTMIEQSVLRLDFLIKDIINYSRNSRTDAEAQLINFKELVEYAVSQFKYIDEAQNMHVDIHADAGNDFYSDKKRIEIVLNNLISNALKYCKPDGRGAVIKISVTTSARQAVLKVTDKGIGISTGNLDKIFQMFYRATNAGSGSGLGLYIVKEIIDKLYGTISVKSEEGKGTTMTVVIPNARYAPAATASV